MSSHSPIDRRDANALLAGIAARLGASEQPWLRELVDAAVENRPARLRHPEEATSALFAGVAAAFAAVITRFNRLPDDLRYDYVTRHLGLSPAAATPERIIVDFPKHEISDPVQLVRGTELTTGTQAAGGRYQIDEPLTLLPWRLNSLYGYRQVGAGRDRFVRHEIAEGALVEPVSPFGEVDDAAVSWAACQWYLASPDLLAARQGTRLTIRLQAVQPAPENGADVLLGMDWNASADDGSIALLKPTITVDGHDVVVVLTMPADIAPTAEVIPGIPPGLPWIRLGPRTATAAAAARNFSCGEVELTIDADDLPLQQFFADGQPLDPGAPFLPFGPTPSAGSSFAVGEDAMFGLRLKTLAIEPLPADGALALFAIDPTHAGGCLRWEALRDGAWKPLMPADGASTSTFGQTVCFDPDPRQVLADHDETTGTRRVRCRLADADFGWQRYLHDHQAFIIEVMARGQRQGSLVGQLGRALMAQLGREEPAAALPPVPPAPPRLSGVRLSFRSAPLRMSRGELTSLGAPDGLCPVPLLADQAGRLAPFRGFGDCGLLILGLAGGTADRQSALYLHMEARPTPDRERGTVLLRYLDPTRGLLPLTVLDETQGLTRSGFIRFLTPASWPAVPCPVLPAYRGPGDASATHWLVLRVDATVDTKSVAERLLNLGLNTVAATGVLADDGRVPDLTPPAPARLLLAQAINGISGASVVRTARFSQPVEPRAHFLNRAAGICRHRQRAVSPWDVERLVHDAFPGIALVRCLRPDVDHLHAQGDRLRVVVVPDVDQRFPSLAAEEQEEIRAHLAAIAPPLTAIELCDPLYIEVAVAARVQARPGLVVAQVRADLARALTRFLQPLSRTGGRQLLGKPLLLSRVRHFVASQPGVLLVESLDFAGVHAGLTVVLPEPADGLITSARRHRLEVIP
jgi:hypothetical protein